MTDWPPSRVRGLMLPGETIPQFATRLGLSIYTVREYLSGRRVPKGYDQVKALEQAESEGPSHA